VARSAPSLCRRAGSHARPKRAWVVLPNAFYRYFTSLDVLIAAAADAVARRLSIAIDQGIAERPDDADDEARVRKLLEVYSDFAESNTTLYRTFLSAKAEAAAELPQPRYHELLWPKVVSIVQPLAGSDNAPAATVTPLGAPPWDMGATTG
jgi:AcrR family transcriptional regulator